MTSGRSLLIVRAEVHGPGVADVRLDGDRVVEVGPALPRVADERVIDARGGALLAGLHDHHLHLFALAASLRSLRCGPPEVRDEPALVAALRAAGAATTPGAWVRGVGYHESVAGPLDRWALDRWLPNPPVRIQHRSGGLWMVNTAAARALDLEHADEAGVERDADGRATGRLWRMDRWLGDRLGRRDVDLTDTGALLARHGITGVTDATPDLDAGTVDALVAATRDGRLPQRVHLLGADGAVPAGARVSVGPCKILLPDHDLPPLDELAGQIRAAHRHGRAVAVHCVTRASLVLTLAAIDDAGPRSGDRIEHGSVMPPELTAMAAAHGVRVVTQPVLLADRGDDYLDDVDPDDVPHLYPYASLLEAGIAVAASSDAPFGDVDPWRGIRAARDRRTATGCVVGPGERVEPATALAGLLTRLDDPGGAPRRVEPGADADLCLLQVPLADALREPSADLVRLTIGQGAVIHGE